MELQCKWVRFLILFRYHEGELLVERLFRMILNAGIGSIPDAVLSQLTNHQHLGVHTEMFSDRLVDLVKLGVITNSMKKMRPGKIVTSFVIGTKKSFDFLDNNPFVDMCDIAWVNSPVIIAQNPRPMAINSCIEVDITGQVVSDSIGSRIYSGEFFLNFIVRSEFFQVRMNSALIELKLIPSVRLGK